MKKILIVLFIQLFSFCTAQIYIPIDTSNYAMRELKSNQYEQNRKKFLDNLKDKFPRKERKFMEGIYKQMHGEFKDLILAGSLLIEPQIDEKLNSILKEIKTNNPEIPNIDLYVTKDYSANAYTAGDDAIILNLGLFHFMENEGQLASVISHEIAHQLLSHSTHKMQERLQLESMNKEIANEIYRTKNNRHKKAFEILKNQMYELSAKSRSAELEADEKGFELFKNTKYDPHEFINALRILAKYDTLKPKGLKNETYVQYFNLPNQAFREKWLELEDFSSYNYDLYKQQIALDSLLSHPETELRIIRLQQLHPELQNEKEFELADEDFKEIQKIAYYEIVPNMYFNEEYGLGIYNALYQLQLGKDTSYFSLWLGNCFMKVYEARKNYTLNRYLDRVDPKNQSESYQKFLNFMWNLSLDEIKNIADYYTGK